MPAPQECPNHHPPPQHRCTHMSEPVPHSHVSSGPLGEPVLPVPHAKPQSGEGALGPLGPLAALFYRGVLSFVVLSSLKEGLALTSVTTVLWKISLLYSQPPWQPPTPKPSLTARVLLLLGWA